MLGKECGLLDGELYNNKAEPIQTTKNYKLKKNIARIGNAVQVTDCKSLLLNVMIQVLQFIRNGQLCH